MSANDTGGSVRVPADIEVYDPDRGKWRPVCTACADALASRGYVRTREVYVYSTPWPRCIYLHDVEAAQTGRSGAS